MEMVVNGVSTRKVARVTEELCGTEFSKSTVSELCGNLDPIVTAWNQRDPHDKTYPFLVIDDHRGLVNAVQKHFQGAVRQHCQTHFTRNILETA